MKIKILLILAVLSVVSISAQSRSGTYSRSDENGRGEVKLKETKKTLMFSILALGKEKGTCNGEMSGVAKFINSTTAEFNADGSAKDPQSGEAIGCRFTFIFLGKNRVKILDKNCDDFHGAACTFEGSYRKKN